MTDPEDALRDLAAASSSNQEPILEPEPTRPESPVSKRPESPSTSDTQTDSAEASASALARLSGSESAPYDPPARSSSRRRKLKKPDVGMMAFRSAAIPVLMTMGLIMIALGVWGLVVKNGNTTLPLADQPNADQLAMIGLVGLPIGILLFAGAGFFFYQLGKDKQKLAAYEEAKQSDRDR